MTSLVVGIDTAVGAAEVFYFLSPTLLYKIKVLTLNVAVTLLYRFTGTLNLRVFVKFKKFKIRKF